MKWVALGIDSATAFKTRRKVLVPGGGVEPPRYQVPADFESAASASSAIPALRGIIDFTATSLFLFFRLRNNKPLSKRHPYGILPLLSPNLDLAPPVNRCVRANQRSQLLLRCVERTRVAGRHPKPQQVSAGEISGIKTRLSPAWVFPSSAVIKDANDCCIDQALNP
jgi:hypothetical protein